jgi:3-deoxy-D-manno-octulosonic-acid transferase
MTTFLYEILFWIAFALSSPYYLLRMRRRGGYAQDFLERFAIFSAAKKQQLRKLKPVWIHAVSVGEVNLALKLIERMRADATRPPLLLSTTTSTGHALASQKLPADVPLIYYPVDSLLSFARVHHLANPIAFVLIEAELWPNHLRFCSRRHIPVALINARLSDRCYPRYRLFKWFFEPAFRGFKAVTLQSVRDSRRLADLGFPAQSLQIVGNLKYDTAEGQDTEKRERLRHDLQAMQDRPMLIAGSTHPGEEELLTDIFLRLRASRMTLALTLAPRHAERAGEIAAMLEQRQLSYKRRSALQSENTSKFDVLILDTTGELKYLYEHATVIFMGKSLTGHGGQNIIEPAAWSKAILFGPHMENFEQIAADFVEDGGAIQVQNTVQLETEIAALLDAPAKRAEMGNRARQTITRRQGAMERTVLAIERMLKESVATEIVHKEENCR